MAFTITKSNWLTYELDGKCKEKFIPWVKFMTTRSMISYALTKDIKLDAEMLEALWSTASFTESNEEMALHCKIKNQDIKIMDHDINRILHFPTNDLVNPPSFDQIKTFFTNICGYTEAINGNAQTLEQKHLVAQWSYFCVTISYCFVPRSKGFHKFSRLIQTLAFAVANNLQINIGRLILRELFQKMGSSNKRSSKCIYPRFLMLFLEDKMPKATFNEFTGAKQDSPRSTHLQLAKLEKKNENLRVRLTAYLNQVMEFPNHPAPEAQNPVQATLNAEVHETLNQAQVAQPVETSVPKILNTTLTGTINQNPPVAAAVQATLNTVRDIITSAIMANPPVASGSSSHQVDNLTPVTQTQLSNTSNTIQPRKRSARKSVRVKGVTIPRIVNKEDNVSEPTALSAHKKARFNPLVTVIPSISSQQDLDLEMALIASLDQASQQAGSIEIGPSVRASVECHSPEVTLLGENQNIIPLARIDNTHGEEHGEFRVSTDSNISSPDPMDLDPTQRGIQFSGTDSELNDNETTLVDESYEEIMLREEKQNKKSGEGEKSGKESQPLNLEVHDKNKECLRENPLSKIPSSSTVGTSTQVPLFENRSDKDAARSDKDEARSDKVEFLKKLDELKGELKLDIQEMKNDMTMGMQAIMEQLKKITHQQSNFVFAAQGLRVDLEMKMDQKLGQMDDKLEKINDTIHGLQCSNARLCNTVAYTEAHTTANNELLKEHTKALEVHQDRIEYVAGGVESIHDVKLVAQQQQLTYLINGSEAGDDNDDGNNDDFGGSRTQGRSRNKSWNLER